MILKLPVKPFQLSKQLQTLKMCIGFPSPSFTHSCQTHGYNYPIPIDFRVANTNPAISLYVYVNYIKL